MHFGGAMVYSFDEQLKVGHEYERQLDEIFSDRFEIQIASDSEQRSGIDRHFRSKRDNKHFTVEYKGDNAALRTGNAFVETVSIDRDNKPGWAFTSQSRLLIYYIPSQIAYIFTFVKLRNQLSRWIDSYPQKSVPNRGYNTIGILVPLNEFERHAMYKEPL